MIISYKWLAEYLPVKVEPDRLSRILTSVGLEVENMQEYEEIKGGLKGLVIGKVLQADQHPNADKLKLTLVDIGNEKPLQIVCGAPNVAVGQKVVVATVGTTIYPLNADPLTMKVAKIRGIESQGMICAEDEIGIGTSHAGIVVMPEDLQPGMLVTDYFLPFTDIIYTIGLTPNRMDAMSHWGVARDVCAFLSHHDKKEIRATLPVITFKTDNHQLSINVTIENQEGCKRYAGLCISGIKIKESPKWLQQRLRSIGLRPINNIVDITNFIQHETGQPLHAFDYDSIKGKKIIIKTLKNKSHFITLDEKERELSDEDLMICDADGPICIAGVFGGLYSGVKTNTTNIFLESAYFDPVFIRKTSFRHGLRTDAATRFEKGIDISNTINVLKRAAMLIRELGEGYIASEIIDVYPKPQPKSEVTIKYHYIKKLSGKNYHPHTIKNILSSLGFSLKRESLDALTFDVPFHKPDVILPADLVEEILRIDGLDNIEIPSNINISPSIETNHNSEFLKEKLSSVLNGLGFSEILTNSITNSAYFSDTEKTNSVSLLNNLSNELNAMRPSMIYTALEVISFNLNRKNANLRLFEFGKTYHGKEIGKYFEKDHLAIYFTGNIGEKSWKSKQSSLDIFYVKGIVQSVLSICNIKDYYFEPVNDLQYDTSLDIYFNEQKIGQICQVNNSILSKFSIKQTVFIADLDYEVLLKQIENRVQYKEISKYPAIERDLALIVSKEIRYNNVKEQIGHLKFKKLKSVKLFDVFESEKLGKNKKSLAINLTFQDDEKTLTDKEIDSWMIKIMNTLKNELNAEIRTQ